MSDIKIQRVGIQGQDCSGDGDYIVLRHNDPIIEAILETNKVILEALGIAREMILAGEHIDAATVLDLIHQKAIAAIAKAKGRVEE
jgi:hypothetical protein